MIDATRRNIALGATGRLTQEAADRRPSGWPRAEPPGARLPAEASRNDVPLAPAARGLH